MILFLIYLGLQLFSFFIHKKSQKNGLESAIVVLTAPLQKGAMTLVSGVGEILRHYVFLSGTSKKNDELGQDIHRLNAELSKLKEVENENIRLKLMVSMAQAHGLDFFGANVVAFDVSPFQNTVRVNKGLKQGVFQGQAVVSTRGIVGQVIQTDAHYSDVMLLMDKVSAIDVINSRTRQRGILRGHGLRALKFEYLPVSSDVQLGDELISSGLDQVYPKGLSVGFVSKVGQASRQLFKEVFVTPYEDTQYLEEVLLVRAQKNIPEPVLPPLPPKATAPSPPFER